MFDCLVVHTKKVQRKNVKNFLQRFHTGTRKPLSLPLSLLPTMSEQFEKFFQNNMNYQHTAIEQNPQVSANS